MQTGITENTDVLLAVFNSATYGIAVMHAVKDEHGKTEDFTMLLLNGIAIKWVGDAAYKGRLCSDVFPAVRETGMLDRFIAVSDTGVTSSFENCYADEGMRNWFRFTAARNGELLVVTTEDITGSKQVETKIREALETAEKRKRLYDSVTNNIPDLVYVFDMSYRFTYANEALLNMWGKSAEDAIGKGLRENGYEEWHALMHEREIDAVAATKKAIRGTVSFPHAELGTRFYDYIFSPVFNKQGEVEAIAGSTRDITELTHTQDNLQRSETRFRNMIEQAPIAILLTKGEDVVIESVNKPMLRFMNKKPENEVIGKKMLDVLPELAGQPALQIVIDVQRTGVSFRGDEQPVDLVIDGSLQRRYFNFSYDMIEESGESRAVMHMAIDVTEQVLARKKIEESEARLRSVIDQTPAPTLVLRGDNLVIEQVNKPMLEMIGQGADIVGHPLIDVLPELRGQYVWEQVQKVYTQGIPFYQPELLVPHSRNGVIGEYYYNLSYRPRRENGQITGMIQVAIEVTEQVVARKKLEESDRRFRALINATSNVIYRMDPDWTRMLELEGRGFLPDTEKPTGDWVERYIDSNDKEKVLSAISKAIAEKNIFELQHRVVSIDGSTRWTFSRAVPILNDDGDIVEWFGAASDVTEKKKAENALRSSEENLRDMVLQSPVGVCVIDADTLVSEIVNDKFVEIAGKPYEEIMSRPYWDAFAEVAPYYQSALQGVIDSGEPFYANEVEMVLIRDGRQEGIYVTFVYEPMKDASGDIKKVVIWVLENTQQVQERRKVEESEGKYRTLSQTLEQQVSERTKELQRSNEDLQQFAHVASHDLKEPVRKIKTFTDRLEQHLAGRLDANSIRYIDRIHIATNRMFTMIEGVLTYSTVNANRQNNEKVDLNEVIRNIETDLEVTLQATGAQINSAELPVLEGAPVLLYQLFYNLINNSIKFVMPGTAPRITITAARTVLMGENFACITVRDNGIGFENTYADSVFDTFTRLNSKDKYEGTGLGLSLCKKIAERHGGSITAAGNPGIGAAFTIMLPLQQK